MPDTSSTLPPLTLADLQRCGVDEILAQPPPSLTYLDMQARFFRAAEVAQADGDASASAALRFLAQICSMRLVPAERADPFKAMLVMNTGRSMIPEDLTAADIDLMADLAPTLLHPLLRARLADLVWLKTRRKGVVFAHMAIEGYRQPPVDCAEFENEGLTCRQRAVQIARSTGRSGDQRVAEIEAELLAAFWGAIEANDHSSTLHLLGPLQTEGLARDEAGKVGTALESIARRQYSQGDAFGSLQFTDRAQYWFSRAGMDESLAAMRVFAAESWIAQANADRSGLSRENCYRKAIDAYQQIPARYRKLHGVTAAIAALRAKLPEVGLDMLAEMKTISHSIDVGELIQEAVERVEGLSPRRAFVAFCRIAPWPSLEALREEASIPLSGLAALFPTTSVDADGRVIAREDGAEDADTREKRLIAEMFKASAQRADISAYARIAPALDVIRLQCHFTPNDFLEITKMSALVPADRADLVAKGLYAGYCRDLTQAIHILVPQFEHMVRNVLKEAGALTTSRQDGIEMELGLSSLVDLPEMKERFGEALTFTICALMCTPLGPNLRNKIAHGMADTALCYSGFGMYTWWLILALVVEGYHMMLRAELANRADAAGET